MAASISELTAQERGHCLRRAGDALPDFGQAVECGRARMRADAAVQPVQVRKARVPFWVGAPGERKRGGVGLRHEDKTPKPHQWQWRIGPGYLPGAPEGLE